MENAILLVCDPGKEQEAIIRMARVGYENVIGYLSNGFESWRQSGKNFDMVISIDADEFKLDYAYDDICIVDVRKENEFEAGHVDGAVNVALQDLDEQLGKIKDKDENIYMHCLSGYRSMIAASLLKRKGYQHIKNIYGGWNAIEKASLPMKLPRFSES
jgi:rhodanese-related sulfurtransferase